MTDKTLADAADAIEEVYYRFKNYTDESMDLVSQAQHLIELSNAISDLASWHPGFDIETGTMPYEREEL